MNRDQTELYEAAKKTRDVYFGEKVSAKTYYKPYQEAKHLKTPLTEYCSEECADVKSGLEMLWAGEEAGSACMKIILAAYMRSKMSGNTTVVPELDLFNYMM